MGEPEPVKNVPTKRAKDGRARHVRVVQVLAVYGSPRAGGNTDTLLDYFLEGCRQAACRVEKAVLRELDILPCSSCNRCGQTGRCVIDDDMTRYYDALVGYECIVFAFPVFFMGPPAVAKAFIDRGQALWVRRFVLKGMTVSDGRKGFLLSTGGFRSPDHRQGERIFSCNISITKAFMSACGVRYSGELLYPGIEGADDVRKSPGIIRDAIKAGREWIGPEGHSNLK